jgi:hypothetical protein
MGRLLNIEHSPVIILCYADPKGSGNKRSWLGHGQASSHRIYFISPLNSDCKVIPISCYLVTEG